jgi:hypothetical protein
LKLLLELKKIDWKHLFCVSKSRNNRISQFSLFQMPKRRREETSQSSVSSKNSFVDLESSSLRNLIETLDNNKQSIQLLLKNEFDFDCVIPKTQNIPISCFSTQFSVCCSISVNQIVQELSGLDKFQEYLHFRQSLKQHPSNPSKSEIKKACLDFLLLLHRITRKNNVYLLLLSASTFLHKIPISQWKTFEKAGTLLDQETIKNWLRIHCDSDQLPCLSKRGKFCVAAIDNQQVARHTDIIGKKSTFVHSISWLEVEVEENLQQLLNGITHIWLERPSGNVFRSFITSYINQLNLRTQFFMDTSVHLDPSLRSVCCNRRDKFWLRPPFIYSRSTDPSNVSGIVNRIYGEYSQHQLFVPIYCDEQIFSEIWNVFFVHPDHKPVLPTLIPMPDFFHFRWHIIRMAFKLYPCLYNVAFALGFRKFSASDNRDGYKLGDAVIRTLLASLLPYFKRKWPGPEQLNNAFSDLATFKSDSSLESILLHFCFFIGAPYLLFSTLICAGVELTSEQFMSIWLYWLPLFSISGKPHYARITATLALLSKWLHPKVWHCVLNSSLMKWKISTTGHSIPVMLALEKMHKRFKKWWGYNNQSKSVLEAVQWFHALLVMDLNLQSLLQNDNSSLQTSGQASEKYFSSILQNFNTAREQIASILTDNSLIEASQKKNASILNLMFKNNELQQKSSSLFSVTTLFSVWSPPGHSETDEIPEFSEI